MSITFPPILPAPFPSVIPLFCLILLLFDYFLLLSPRNIQLTLTFRFVTDISLFYSILSYKFGAQLFFLSGSIGIVWNIEIYFELNPKPKNRNLFSFWMVLHFFRQFSSLFSYFIETYFAQIFLMWLFSFLSDSHFPFACILLWKCVVWCLGKIYYINKNVLKNDWKGGFCL